MRKEQYVKVDGKSVRLSNLDKVFYPENGFTKGALIKYYVEVAGALLPHVRDRAVTLKRYPDGVEGSFFYEKQCPPHAPPWIKTTRVKKTEGMVDYCLLGDLPSLVWAANLANLELHCFLHRAGRASAAVVVFDCDPGAPADLVSCCGVGLMVRSLCSAGGLESFAKTSGSKGLQVYVPLNGRATYEHTKEFAHRMALSLERRHPTRIVSRMAKTLRTGKVLVDWSQNDDHKTTVAVYSLRAGPVPRVSAPVTWTEIEEAWNRKSGENILIGPEEALCRLARLGDLLAPVLTLQQRLPTTLPD